MFCRFNGLLTFDALLQGAADPSIKDKKGSTPLHFAARRGNDEIVKVLLEHPKVKVDDRDSSGKTAFHMACSEGQSRVCQLLLDKGADIKAVTADNTTPLHTAILNGHSQLATMILNQGKKNRYNRIGERITGVISELVHQAYGVYFTSNVCGKVRLAGFHSDVFFVISPVNCDN